MKKTLIALAVLASSGAAMAQSTFTLYGIADAALAREKGSFSSNLVKSGQLSGSRWGLKGSEDLGGGLKGVFQLESGFDIDTGASGQSGRLFGRTALVGVEGSFGKVTIGRQNTPIYNVEDMSSAHGANTKSYDVMTIVGTIGNSLRADNAINYKSPTVSGFTAEAQYSTAYDVVSSLKADGTTSAAAFSETNSGASPKQGRMFGFSGAYANGPIMAAVGYVTIQDTKQDVTKTTLDGDQKRSEWILTAGYNFGVANVVGYYNQTDPTWKDSTTKDGVNKMKVYGLNAAFPFGAFTVTPGVAIAKDVLFLNTTGVSTKDDATLYTLQTKYDLSKRTNLYSNIVVVDNKDGLAKGFNTPNKDSTSYGIQFGVRHSF